MNTDRFRDDIISINGESYTLRFKPINKIFKFNEPPYLCVGNTTAGKSTICIDIIHKFGKEASRIYYVSATKEMIADNAITTIPRVYRRGPSFQELYSIWKELRECCEYMNMGIPDLIELIAKIYPENENKIIQQKFNTWVAKMTAELTNKYKNMNTNDLNVKISSDLDILKTEILTRIILSGINIHGTDNLDNIYLIKIQTLLSSEQKTIVLLDDVSAELERLKNDPTKVLYGDPGKEIMMPVAKAYKALLTDIFTKARRYNCIVAMFVHTWGIIENKDLIKNFVILDPNSAKQLNGLRTVGNAKTRDLVKVASDKIFGKYPYHILVIKDSDIYVTKADMHVGGTVELDELNKRFINVCNDISAGVDLSIKKEIDDDVNNIIDNIDDLIN